MNRAHSHAGTAEGWGRRMGSEARDYRWPRSWLYWLGVWRPPNAESEKPRFRGVEVTVASVDNLLVTGYRPLLRACLGGHARGEGVCHGHTRSERVYHEHVRLRDPRLGFWQRRHKLADRLDDAKDRAWSVIVKGELDDARLSDLRHIYESRRPDTQ